MRSRPSRRAPQEEEDFAENGDSPSILQSLLDDLTDLVARSALLRLRHGTRRLVKWSLRQALLAWVTAAVLTVGMVLLLFAGVRGLEAAGCPSWVAYLSSGAAAVIAALGMLRGVLAPEPEDDER
jgi:hypothetical protein